MEHLTAQQCAQLIHPALESYQSIYNVESWMQQPHMGKVLATVAASIIHSSSGMSKWGIADLTLGLYKLSGRHALEGAADTIPGFPVMYRSELDNMLQWLQWAEAAYKRDKPSLASAVQIPETDVVKMVTASAVLKPAFFIAVHHRHKCVVLGIHGTYARNDILTDLTPHCESFKGVRIQRILAAARWLLHNEGHTPHHCIQSNPLRLWISAHWPFTRGRCSGTVGCALT